jgi:small GTP-binding protein
MCLILQVIFSDIFNNQGPEEYSAMQDQYFRATDAVLLCCDLMDSSSIDEMRNKMENLLRAKDADVGTLPIIISVNKCDLGLTDANLSMDQVREFAEEYKIPQIIYTSALENTNVTEVFSELVAIYVNVLQRHPEWIQKLENGEPITTMPTKKKCSVM